MSRKVLGVPQIHDGEGLDSHSVNPEATRKLESTYQFHEYGSLALKRKVPQIRDEEELVSQ